MLKSAFEDGRARTDPVKHAQRILRILRIQRIQRIQRILRIQRFSETGEFGQLASMLERMEIGSRVGARGKIGSAHGAGTTPRNCKRGINGRWQSAFVGLRRDKKAKFGGSMGKMYKNYKNYDSSRSFDSFNSSRVVIPESKREFQIEMPSRPGPTKSNQKPGSGRPVQASPSWIEPETSAE